MDSFSIILNLESEDNLKFFKFSNPHLNQEFCEIQDSPLHIKHITGSHYPLEVIKFENCIIYFEGCIYNLTTDKIIENLKKIVNTKDINEKRRHILNFQEIADGEFNFYILNTENNQLINFLFFNDRLGRLQTYYHVNDSFFILSRNLKQVAKNLPLKNLNSYSICDSLIFGFPLDNKTIFSEISTTNESQYLEIELNLKTRALHSRIGSSKIDLNYSHKYKSKHEYIEDVYPILRKSINVRTNFIGTNNFTCDITGGFDSRTVFGFLLDNPLVKFTSNNILGNESDTASELLSRFNLKSKLTIIPSEELETDPKIDQLLYHVQNFTGNHLANKISWQALNSQKKIADLPYRIGGIGFTDFIRKGIRRDSNSLIQTFLHQNPYGLSINQAIHLLNLSEKEYLEHINKTIAKWPEKSKEEIHKKFFYLRTLILQSRLTEDRERLHYWNIHPLWNAQLCFRSLQNFPLEWRGYHIHYLLLKKINADLVGVHINKSYLDIKNEKSLKKLDFKENNKIYLGLKSLLKPSPKKNTHFNSINNIDEFLDSDSTILSGNAELDYIKLSFKQLNS